MADPVIQLDEVSRTFPARKPRQGPVRALDRLSLAIQPGEVVGLLGHNGAGKTTVVRLIAGILPATDGRVQVAELDPVADGATLRRRLGVLPTSAFLDNRLTARQNLEFAAELFAMPPRLVRSRIAELLTRFELDDRADDKVDGFSAGMRQRLGLARVLLPDPEVLLLDEPSAALDPLAVRMVRHLIGELARDAGRTVVLCTHDLAEAQLLCDRVVVLDHGRTIAVGAPSELAARLAVGAIDVRVAEASVDSACTTLAKYRTECLPDNTIGGTTTVRCSPVEPDEIPDLVRSLVDARVPVYGVQAHQPALEDVYVALYDRNQVPGNGTGHAQ